MKQNKAFQLIVVIPVIAYTILETFYDPMTAVIGGMIIATIEILIEKLVFKHLLKLAMLNFILIAGLGGVSLVQENEIWFKLFPSLTSLFVGFYLLYQIRHGKSVLGEFMDIMQPNNPQKHMLPFFEREMAYFSIWFGGVMAVVPFAFSTNVWAFMKVFGSIILFFLHIAVRMLILKRSPK